MQTKKQKPLISTSLEGQYCGYQQVLDPQPLIVSNYLIPLLELNPLVGQGLRGWQSSFFSLMYPKHLE